VLRGLPSLLPNRLDCQATDVASSFRLASSRSPLSRSSFEGARNLLRFRRRCQLASSTRFSCCPSGVACAAFSAQREAASTTAASRVNFVSSTVYFVFPAASGGPHRQCGFAFPSVGARLLASRPPECQPPSSTLAFPFSRPLFLAEHLPGSGDAASTTTAFGVNPTASTPYFLCPSHDSHRQRGFAFPSEGTRLLLPPRLESTPLRRLLISSVPERCPTANAVSPSRPRGRGFYHRRVECQPPSPSLFFPPIHLAERVLSWPSEPVRRSFTC